MVHQEVSSHHQEIQSPKGQNYFSASRCDLTYRIWFSKNDPRKNQWRIFHNVAWLSSFLNIIISVIRVLREVCSTSKIPGIHFLHPLEVFLSYNQLRCCHVNTISQTYLHAYFFCWSSMPTKNQVCLFVSCQHCKVWRWKLMNYLYYLIHCWQKWKASRKSNASSLICPFLQ